MEPWETDEWPYRHGTRWSYVKGCRCPECKAINSVKDKEYRLRAHNGVVGRVDAGPSADRLRALLSMGYTYPELNRFGISTATIVNLLNGRAKRVLRSTEAKIMGVSGRKLSDSQLIDARAAQALVSRWCDRGLSYREISRITGVSRSTLKDLREKSNDRCRYRVLRALLDGRNAVERYIVDTEGGVITDKGAYIRNFAHEGS